MTSERVTLTVLPTYTRLTEESVTNYFKAKHTAIPLLRNRIIDPFAELVKARTGFTAENLPNGEIVENYTYESITFTVTSSRRTKRPALEEVFSGLQDYLRFVQSGYQGAISRKGVRTFLEKPYVLLDDVMTEIAKRREEVTVPGLVQSLTDDYNSSNLDAVVVPLSQPITLTPGNGLLYARAKALEDHLKKAVVKPLEDALKAETGYSKDNVPPETTGHITSIGDNLFEVNTIPKPVIKYDDILTDLTKDAPDRITVRSRIGDLVRVQKELELPTDLYDPRNESGAKGNQYISVQGMLLRLEELKVKRTHRSVTQLVHSYPAF